MLPPRGLLRVRTHAATPSALPDGRTAFPVPSSKPKPPAPGTSWTPAPPSPKTSTTPAPPLRSPSRSPRRRHQQPPRRPSHRPQGHPDTCVAAAPQRPPEARAPVSSQAPAPAAMPPPPHRAKPHQPARMTRCPLSLPPPTSLSDLLSQPQIRFANSG